MHTILFTLDLAIIIIILLVLILTKDLNVVGKATVNIK